MQEAPGPPAQEPVAPILGDKHYEAPSVLTPENLLRDGRRQQDRPIGAVPPICVLDPDGDLRAYLRTTGRATRHPAWACYHTELDTFGHAGRLLGIVGGAVGAAFAVLVAEELLVSGCRLVISITSAGQITPLGAPPYFVLIEQALRDEGTSYHYLPPARYSRLRPALGHAIRAAWEPAPFPLYAGASWTTDAPFRETAAMIATCRRAGILAVEMEAAALYALATARGRDICCFAHITNQLGQSEGDFEKGAAQGSLAALAVIERAAAGWDALGATKETAG